MDLSGVQRFSSEKKQLCFLSFQWCDPHPFHSAHCVVHRSLKSSISPSPPLSGASAAAYAAPIITAEAPELDTPIWPGASMVARPTVLDHFAPVSAPRLDVPEGAAQRTPQPHMLESVRFPVSVTPAPPVSLRGSAVLDEFAGGQVTEDVDALQPPQGSVGAEPRRASYDADSPPPTYIA